MVTKKGAGGTNYKSGINRSTILYIKQINNKVLLYSGEGSGTPLQYSCLENPMDGGAWYAAVHGVAEGRTRLSDFTFTFHFNALEKEMATPPVFLPGEFSMAMVHGVAESDTTEVTKHALYSAGN